MPEFRLESRTRDGKWLADLPFRDLQAEFFYNKPSTLRATLSTTALNQLTKEFIEPARTEVQLWRNNVCIFTGPLWDLSISSGEGTAKLVCESIESYFSKRYVKSAANRTGTYGNIMWSFVVDTQAQQFGNLFVTRGSTTGPGAPSGGLQPSIGTYLDEVFDDLSDGARGFDWYISPTRVLHQFYPRISNRANVRLDYPGTILKYSVGIQGKSIANDVRCIGKDALLGSPVVDTNSMATYGRMEHVESESGTDNARLLKDKAEEYANRRFKPVQVPQLVLNSATVNPLDGDISYGQIVRVAINDGYVQYDDDMRCTGFQLTVGKHFEELFNLYLNTIN